MKEREEVLEARLLLLGGLNHDGLLEALNENGQELL